MLLLAWLMSSALAQQPAALRDLDFLVKEGKTWARESFSGEDSHYMCPKNFRLVDKTIALNSHDWLGGPNEDAKNGDMHLEMEGFWRTIQGTEERSGWVEPIRFRFRPKAPNGEHTLGDKNEFTLGVTGHESWMESHPDRLVLGFDLYSYTLVNVTTLKQKLEYDKKTGAMTFKLKRGGFEEIVCKYQLEDIHSNAVNQNERESGKDLSEDKLAPSSTGGATQK